jgi:hypothetical protein
MGKNFSLNNVSKKRKENDFYETPFSMTEQLLKAHYFGSFNSVLEPACGNGAIVKVLQTFFNEVHCYDITEGIDFFDEKQRYDYIITNPPYSSSFNWIKKCKEVATKKFALLLPLSYLHGKKRHDEIWMDKTYPLTNVYVFTRYPMLGDKLRDDGKYRTGMQVYAWYIWDKLQGTTNKRKSITVVDWIDNNAYVDNTKIG